MKPKTRKQRSKTSKLLALALLSTSGVFLNGCPAMASNPLAGLFSMLPFGQGGGGITPPGTNTNAGGTLPKTRPFVRPPGIASSITDPQVQGALDNGISIPQLNAGADGGEEDVGVTYPVPNITGAGTQNSDGVALSEMPCTLLGSCV